MLEPRPRRGCCYLPEGRGENGTALTVVDSSKVFEGSEDLLAECLELRIHRIGNPEVFSFCFGKRFLY